MIASLFTFNHITDTFLAVAVGLRFTLIVVRIRKRRLEKLLERLEDEYGE
jgi:hypothetical protein